MLYRFHQREQSLGSGLGGEVGNLPPDTFSVTDCLWAGRLRSRTLIHGYLKL